MTNMSIQPLWLTNFIEILFVHEFQLTKFNFGTFSYKAHFRPQISSNEVKSQLSAWTTYTAEFAKGVGRKVLQLSAQLRITEKICS